MKRVELFEAFDGERFPSAEACRAHEAQHVEGRLVGLSLDQVKAALSREDTDLADALEELGARIARARRSSGELRRGSTKAEVKTEPKVPEGPNVAPESSTDDAVGIDERDPSDAEF